MKKKNIKVKFSQLECLKIFKHIINKIKYQARNWKNICSINVDNV